MTTEELKAYLKRRKKLNELRRESVIKKHAGLDGKTIQTEQGRIEDAYYCGRIRILEDILRELDK